jgi:hypothetical protein
MIGVERTESRRIARDGAPLNVPCPSGVRRDPEDIIAHMDMARDRIVQGEDPDHVMRSLVGIGWKAQNNNLTTIMARAPG